MFVCFLPLSFFFMMHQLAFVSSNRDLGKTELGELDYHSSRNARLVTVAVN